MKRLCLPTAALLLVTLGISQAENQPQRIVSLAPNLTEMLLETGFGERLVAVTPFCEAPEKILRLPGGMQPEAEEVLALQPDLVLATPITPATTRAQLIRLGLRVEVVETSSLEDIRRAMKRLAKLIGVAAPSLPGAPPAHSTRSAALFFGADTGYSAGRGTHAHELLEAAGLQNIAAEIGGPWPQVSEEFLFAADPDVIIVADYGNSSRDTVLATLQNHPVRRHLGAVQSGRIVIFPAPVFSVPGPAALEAGAALRAEVEKL